MIEYNLEPEYESCLDEIDKIKKKNENIKIVLKDYGRYLDFQRTIKKNGINLLIIEKVLKRERKNQQDIYMIREM